MNSAYERLKAVITALGYSSNEKFEDTVGLGHGFVSRITNRVSSKSLQAITSKFPQVNPSYIRTGMGEMFISSPIKVSENENAKTRLREYLKYKGITKREFCDKADVASNFPIIGKNGVFTARVSYRVNSKFPDLNMDWLANGAGEMLQPEANIEKFNNYKSRIAPFCTEMGISTTFFLRKCKSYTSAISRLPDMPSETFLKNISLAYPQLNLNWLKTGEGKMFNNDIKSNINSSVSFVPLVPQMAYAGYLSGYADDVYISSLPTIPIVKEDKEKYVAFEVSGDSMDDGSSRAYQNGDIVICKVCPDYMVKNNGLHIDGKEYIIVHKEGILLKRIIDLDMNNGKLVLRSFNPTYRDLELDLADVKQLLVVEYQQKRKG